MCKPIFCCTAFIKSNKLTNGNLNNERKTRKMNWMFSYQLKTYSWFLGLSVTLILLTIIERIEQKVGNGQL